MNYSDFVSEAHHLAKKAVRLSFDGAGEPVGYWHGTKNGGDPLISVKHGNVWLNVILQEFDGGSVRVTELPVKSSIPLFATEFESLPPVDGLFLRGSEAIAQFLEANDWERTEPFNDNFPGDIPAKYERLWQENCPLYAGGVVAVMGGWNFPWPEGDWYELEGAELVLWVLEDAEPWIEVFNQDGRWVVKQRVT